MGSGKRRKIKADIAFIGYMAEHIECVGAELSGGAMISSHSNCTYPYSYRVIHKKVSHRTEEKMQEKNEDDLAQR